MTVVAFLIQPPHTYAVYYHHFDSNSVEITETEDVLADVVQYDVIFDPFRTGDLVVVDLSRLS